MGKKELRIVFMGTPEFAVPSLEILVKNGFTIAAVITAPDKPAGRGLKLRKSAIKKKAEQFNLPVLQPVNLKDPSFIEQLRNYRPNLQIVVAFRMLPEVVWNLPKYGTFNLHASLLPQYRGAAPINWAIINGEKETGVTTFFLKHNIDTGDIILQEKISIGSEDDAGTVYQKCMETGAELVLRTVKKIEADAYTLKKQDERQAIPAPKIFKETARIDLSKTSREVKDFVRGLSPYPGAWLELNGKQVKVFKVRVLENQRGRKEDKIYDTDNKTYFHLYTGNGAVAVEDLQMEGKKRMQVEEFLRGNKL